jgi:DMSO/TMAO reductase YedYZ heme-binding membrane subunit
MSAGFQAVQWNRAKIIYDAIVVAGVIAYVAAFLAIASWINPPKNTGEAIGLRIQAFGSCAFIMLTVILSIGPLARLDRRFLPLLYNRRHLGVMTFCVVLAHVWFMIDWYLVQNALPNLGNELTDWASYGRFIGFPFKVLGIAAFLVMFLMAATSHDYWLAFLSPRV